MDQNETERLARRFHDIYEQLAPQFGCRERSEPALAWTHLSNEKQALMIATVGVVMQEIESEKTDAQRLEFDRNHWQRKVGVLLALIGERDPELIESAHRAVNTNWYTQAQNDPIADVAKMTVDKTIETAVEAGIVSKTSRSNGAG